MFANTLLVYLITYSCCNSDYLPCLIVRVLGVVISCVYLATPYFANEDAWYGVLTATSMLILAEVANYHSHRTQADLFLLKHNYRHQSSQLQSIFNVSHEAVIVFKDDTIKFKNASGNKLFEHERIDRDEAIERVKLFSRREEGGSAAALDQVEQRPMWSLVEINQVLLARNENESQTLQVKMKHRDPLNQPGRTRVTILRKDVFFGEASCSLMIIKDEIPLRKLE